MRFILQRVHIILLMYEQIHYVIDSTSIKVHPNAAGCRKSSGKQSIGRSKGG